MPNAEDKLHGHSLPARSFIVVWDTATKKPKVKASHWEAGYTEAHQKTEDLAIAYAMQETMKRIDEVRQQWILLNILAGEHIADTLERSGEMQLAEMGFDVSEPKPEIQEDH